MESVIISGYEGIMLRRPDGHYKFGRSTIKEGLLIKIKETLDAEALVVGFEELKRNQNPLRRGELGQAVRSSHKSNLVGADTLGSIIAETDSGVLFKIGTGFNERQRKEIWEQREDLIGSWVRYTYSGYGIKDAPRFPVFLSFRPTWDQNEENSTADGI